MRFRGQKKKSVAKAFAPPFLLPLLYLSFRFPGEERENHHRYYYHCYGIAAVSSGAYFWRTLTIADHCFLGMKEAWSKNQRQERRIGGRAVWVPARCFLLSGYFEVGRLFKQVARQVGWKRRIRKGGGDRNGHGSKNMDLRNSYLENPTLSSFVFPLEPPFVVRSFSLLPERKRDARRSHRAKHRTRTFPRKYDFYPSLFLSSAITIGEKRKNKFIRFAPLKSRPSINRPP